jgi:hypothetical protein
MILETSENALKSLCQPFAETVLFDYHKRIPYKEFSKSITHYFINSSRAAVPLTVKGANGRAKYIERE